MSRMRLVGGLRRCSPDSAIPEGSLAPISRRFFLGLDDLGLPEVPFLGLLLTNFKTSSTFGLDEPCGHPPLFASAEET